METTEHGWTIIDADKGVLTYTYSFAKGATANSFTARLASGGLLVLSPPTRMSREAAADLEAFGEVEAVATNNGFHHLGISSWRGFYPNARFFAAEGAAARIAKKSKVAGELEPLSKLIPLLADGVAVVETPSSKCGETWARAELTEGYAWYGSDIVANFSKLPSGFLLSRMFKWTGSAPGYRLFNLAHKFILKDRKAVLRAMLEDVRQHPPRVMVPGHGPMLDASTVAAQTEALLSQAVG